MEEVYNSEDISGIVCSMQQKNSEVIACGLTHLIISPKHPLFKEVIDYQKKEIKE